MGGRRLGLFDGFADKGVVAVREVVSALIAIEGRRDSADVNSFSRPSVVPIIVSGQYLYVALPKVVVGVRCMLHYR